MANYENQIKKEEEKMSFEEKSQYQYFLEEYDMVRQMSPRQQKLFYTRKKTLTEKGILDKNGFLK